MARLRILLFASVLCNLAVYGHGQLTTPKLMTIILPSSAVTRPADTSISSQASSSSGASESSSSQASLSSGVTESGSSQASLSSGVTESGSSQASLSSGASASTEAETTPATSTTPPPKTTSTTTTPLPPPPPTPKPAPTPAPGPVPAPEQGMWSYTDKSNITCILVQFAAQFNVTYNKNVNDSTSLACVLLNVPKNATVLDGSCNVTGSGEQFLQLGWPTAENILTLHFQMNATTKSYALSSLNVSLAPEQFPNSSWKEPVQLSHKVGWWTPLATSYRCAEATQLNMSTEVRPEVATLTLTKLQEEAFRNVNTTSFSAARDCGGSAVPDAVPIAVGCALGGLVVVVLVAYLVGRRRSAARGYLSM